MRKNILLFLTICLPFFVYSQKWQQYSDSIAKIIQVKFDQNGLERANEFIQLADNDLEISGTIIRDTTYADYLYRKGYVKFNLGQFTPSLFEESLAIWNLSSNINYMKIMKNHYFLGAGYHLKLDYPKAYENYEKCYLINKKNKIPWNYNFSNATYYLSVIDYNTNKDFKKAKQYAQEYIEDNKESALLNYDFNYAYAFMWMGNLNGYENILLEFNKNYKDQKLNNPQLHFKIIFELFTCYYKLNNFKEIINYGEKSIELYNVSNINNDKYLKDLYPKLVYAYSEINDNINADIYRQLYQKYFQIKSESDYLLVLDKLDKAKDYSNFKLKFDEYETIYQVGNQFNLLFYLYSYYMLNLYEKNIIFNKEDILKRIDFINSKNKMLSKDDRMNFDLFIADFYLYNKQYKEALKICNQNTDIENIKRKLSFMRIKSWCQNYLGDYHGTKKTIYESYKIANSFYDYLDPRMLPIINNILSMDYIGSDSNSTKIAAHALKILYDNKLEDTYIAIRTWTLLGNQAMFNNNNSDAKKYFEKSIAIQKSAKSIEDRNDYLLCLRNLGYLKLKEPDFEGAKLYLDRAKLFLDQNPNLDKSLFGDYYNSLGDLYFIKFQLKEAILNYEKSFEILGNQESKIHNFNYILCKYFLGNDVPNTINSLEQFQKDNNELNHVSNIIYLLKYNSGDINSAQNHLVNQLNILISENNQYFHLLSDYEKEILFKKFTEQFEFLNSYLFNGNNNFISQYVNFRFYSKSLLFSNSFKVSDDLKSQELYEKLKNNTTQINKAIENNSGDLEEIEDFKYKNREIEKLLSTNSKPSPVPNLKDLNSKLKKEDAYVEIIRINKQSKNNDKQGLEVILDKFTDSISYGAIIIKKNEAPKFILIDGSNKLENQFINNFKNKIQNKIEDITSYELLFEKIDLELKDVKKIYLVTDGVYNSINIESIYNPNKKQFVIDYLKIQQIQNVRAITDEQKEFKIGSTSKASLLGNPDFDLVISNLNKNEFSLDRNLDSSLLDEIKADIKINSLAGTEKEIEILNSILTEAKCAVEMFSTSSATEDNLKKVQSPDILHIATHGYFLKDEDTSKTKQSLSELINDNYKDNSYLKSGLLLAGAQNTLNGNQPENANNGILTAEEAKSLNLKDTELVVLSACETGLGDNLVGAGVIGLQRAFMIAGAKSVIISLWSVSDEKTQQLMTLFYTNWIKNNMSKEEALYQAKIEMKKLYPQPYYWAGFVLLV